MPTWQVAASSDDCYRRLNPVWFGLAPGEFLAGAAPSGGAGLTTYGSGARFLNVTIPNGSTITEAYLTIRAGVTRSVTVVNTRISAEDVDNAPTFADDGAAFDTRWAARTTARVEWDAIGTWIQYSSYDSPDIKTVIQEIVDRPGWASGNALVIFWEDFDARSTGGATCYREGTSYDGSTTWAPKLVIAYGPQASPTVTNQAVTSITGIAATGNGNITSLGDSPVTEHGHCWNTTGTPTTANSKTTKGNGLVGAFTSSITGLTPGTLYYVRSYATNGGGTSYGAEVTFTTLSTATLTTQAVTDVVTTTATGNGNITSIGGSAVTQHGHCWNTTGSPTTADSKTTNGAGVAGAFTSAMTELVEGTKYYVRAYATNSSGTSYGDEVVFWAGLGIVYPIDPLTRVSGIRWVFDASRGKVPDYYMEVFLGGVTTSYVPAITNPKPVPAITPIIAEAVSQIVARGRPGFQQSDYESYLRRTDINAILRAFGHFPTYAEWLDRQRVIMR